MQNINNYISTLYKKSNKYCIKLTIEPSVAAEREPRPLNLLLDGISHCYG